MTKFLEIYEISKPNDFEFYKGENKILNYKIKNSSVWPIKDIKLKAYTVDPDGNKTNTNYVLKINEYPERLMPKGTFDIQITMSLPEQYSDQYMIKDGEYKGQNVLCPIDVNIEAHGTELISRISI